jgi:hypothetical protein
LQTHLQPNNFRFNAKALLPGICLPLNNKTPITMIIKNNCFFKNIQKKLSSETIKK